MYMYKRPGIACAAQQAHASKCTICDTGDDPHLVVAKKAFALAEARSELFAEKAANFTRNTSMYVNFLKAYGGEAHSEDERQQAKRQLYKEYYGGVPETPSNADLIKHDFSAPSAKDVVKHDFSDPYCVSDRTPLCKNCGYLKTNCVAFNQITFVSCMPDPSWRTKQDATSLRAMRLLDNMKDPPPRSIAPKTIWTPSHMAGGMWKLR